MKASDKLKGVSLQELQNEVMRREKESWDLELKDKITLCQETITKIQKAKCVKFYSRQDHHCFVRVSGKVTFNDDFSLRLQASHVACFLNHDNINFHVKTFNSGIITIKFEEFGSVELISKDELEDIYNFAANTASVMKNFIRKYPYNN